jgi:transposase
LSIWVSLLFLSFDKIRAVPGTFVRGEALPPRTCFRDVTFKMPDYEYVHAELAKPNVTLKLLWEEYVNECQDNSERFYMETQFRNYYHKFARVHKATIRLEHKPALSLEVDWAGTKIAFFDSGSGKMAEASLFVSVLPCSQLIYVEPFRDEKLPSWVAGHIHASLIGG